MKPSILLAASVLLNLALAIYLLTGRSSAPAGAPVPFAEPSRKSGSAATPGNGASGSDSSASRRQSIPPPQIAASAAPVSGPSADFVAAPASGPIFSDTIRRPARAVAPSSANGDAGPRQSGSAQADASLGEGQAVNPAAPGNSLRFHGIRAAVAQAYPSGKGGGPALGVDLSADPSSGQPASNSAIPGIGSANGTALAESASPNPATASGGNLQNQQNSAAQSASAPGGTNRSSGGFTQEDLLFRMKWGWAAFDAARTAARKEAGLKASQ
ncbi:MAG: hypothetical protein PHQ12_14950 [Chthoniobacteraceae bacterium]|nr:hypothetical protein [Chthoniobacteraceae bacterium]